MCCSNAILRLSSAVSTFSCSVLIRLSAILRWINDILVEKFDIHIYALWKYLYYVDKGNLSNGRNELYEAAVDAISRGGVLGNGIGYFESLSIEGIPEGTYVHNCVLQALSEGGLIFTIPLIVLVLFSTYILIAKTNCMNNKEYLYFAMVFSYGTIMLFYSSVYWIWVPFWYFVGFLMYQGKKYRRG